MKAFYISTTEAVTDFLYEIYTRKASPFDPAEDLRTLRDINGAPLFPAQEAEYLDNIMMECFVYCVLNDLDIYTLVNKVQSKIFGIRTDA